MLLLVGTPVDRVHTLLGWVPNRSTPTARPGMLNLLRRAETTGQAPRSLLALPEVIASRADGAESGSSEASERRGGWSTRMGVLLLRLERSLERNRTTATIEAVELKPLITEIGIRVSESRSQRDAFLTCSGDVLLLKLLHLLSEQHGVPQVQQTINELIQILAELAISDGHLAEAFATHQSLLALLFRLMGQRELVDASLTLAQELLAIGPEIFPLSCVPQLPALLTSLSPRLLALVGRALAVLLAKAAEDPMEGLPAPECVAPNLCASCSNNQLLLAVPELLPRIVGLLRLRTPPPGLWGHMLAQLPNAAGLVEHLHDEGEQSWSNLGEAAPTPHVVVLLSPDQVPPALRELVAANPAVIFPGLTLPPAMQHGGEPPGSLSLSALQAALWSTLQADLLYVLWALMGSKTKAEAQRRLMDLGLLTVLEDMFDRLDWRPPPPAIGNSMNAEGIQMSSPQSCLQMQLLRTLQVLCEKDSQHPAYHRLLLKPAVRERVTESEADSRDQPSSEPQAPPSQPPPQQSPQPPQPTAPEPSLPTLPPSTLPSPNPQQSQPQISQGGHQAIFSALLAALAEGNEEGAQTAAEVPGSVSATPLPAPPLPAPSTVPSVPLSAPAPSDAAPTSTPAGGALSSGSAEDAGNDERVSGEGAGATTSVTNARQEGLLVSLLKMLLAQPSSSAYHLALASCVHKWVQAASVHDQRRIARYPGLVPYVLDQLLATPARSVPYRTRRTLSRGNEERALRPSTLTVPDTSHGCGTGAAGAPPPSLL